MLFRSKTAHKQYLEWLDQEFHASDGPVILEEEKVVEPEPLDHVLSTVKAILRDTRYSVAEHFQLDADDVKMRVILSGPGNFRNDIATVREYKGNRKESHKPHWYQQIRNYLTEWWDAEVVEGREADDECSIVQHVAQHATIIATIDKDLDQVPGWHYDYVRKTFYRTEPDEGHLLFYRQVLSGDSTDNIPGAYKIGAARAASIVDECYLEHGMDHHRIWEAIVQAYTGTLDKHGEACPYFEKANREGVESVCIEMARLVKMQEYIGQLWTPPGQPDETLEVHFDE